MNRHQRRAAQRQCHAMMRGLRQAVELTGLPAAVTGFDGSCSDCHADGVITLHPGHKATIEIWHDDGCPTLTGAVTWQPIAPDEGESA